MGGSAKPALLGAAAGAVLTLLLHPVSRPFLGVVFWHPPAIDANEPLPGDVPSRLKPPVTLLDASIWMQAACERYRLEVPLRTTEVSSAIRVAENAATTDPDNAFWKQMAAVFLFKSGDKRDADSYWARASRCAFWNDYQTKRLLLMQTGIKSRYRVAQSWQLAKLYQLRSNAPAQQIELYASKRLEQAPLDTLPGLLERYVTLRNGNLIRRGAQSLAAGGSGAAIVDAASGSKAQSPGRKTETARSTYERLLLSKGFRTYAMDSRKIFLDNEAWLRFINDSQAQGNVDRLALASIVTATAPSAMLALAILGLCVWLLGIVIQRSSAVQAALRYPAVFSIGLTLAFGTYALTFTPLAGVAIGLSAAFLAFTPRNERTKPPADLGPFFRTATLFLAVVFSGVMALFFIIRTPPSEQLMTGMNLVSEPDAGSAALGGLGLLCVGLLMLIAPFWAHAVRVRTTSVLSSAFQLFGSWIATVCLTGGIVLTLVSIYFDHALSVTLGELVQNEPTHYYLRRG